MKVYSIGRETGCDIVINDTTDVISRRHATLNVGSLGKMTLVDTSRNGTYVNGIRINSNVPFPVTRKDNVSFAHVARLDWNLVPKSNTAMRYAIIAFVAVLLVVCGVAGYNYWGGPKPEPSKPVITAADSAKAAQEKERNIRKSVEDSIKHRQDSIKQREDSIKQRKNAAIKGKKDTTKVSEKKPKQDNKKDSNKRRMGN